jgi:hypothetical protein
MIVDPALVRVEADLEKPEFRAGVDAGRWRVVASAFPLLDIAILATEPDGSHVEYGFRFELSNFPAQAPMVRIWDLNLGTALSPIQRPKGDRRVLITFQAWTSDTVYRPWDRLTGPHIGNAAELRHLAWHADRGLSFILEDLHGILNSNARAHRIRSAA